VQQVPLAAKPLKVYGSISALRPYPGMSQAAAR
jgi:hypothetical protein